MALGRGKSEEEVRQVARGRAWTGQDALQHGLVDALGGLDLAIKLAKAEAHLPLKVHPHMLLEWHATSAVHRGLNHGGV